ncbi:DUF1016 N-terminal domain-containing protein, partial [uncultured Thiodictyon sp.]|uniref:DUF1016 N-terminal domain-containing protein n=1 Tax=uncultured Thiodictyon sp. TaxID=1846217 RepID=UPI0025F22F7C
MKSQELAVYRDLLGDIKTRVRQAQHRAALSANAEMILMYWDIGRMIAARQEQEGWGAGVIPRLALDLKNELPEQKGFSERNIKRMVQFWSAYPSLFQIGPRPVAQLLPATETPVATGEPGLAAPDNLAAHDLATLSWAHNIVFLQIKDLSTRLWYARQTLEQGWSRDTLTVQIKHRAHERQGGAVTNVANTLPEPHASLA